MNQDQVKNLLLEIRPCTKDFTLIFSGKSSKKVNGLYHPDTQEIIIHNRNFANDTLLLYTAIHEYAHHLEHCAGVAKSRHTRAFYALCNDLYDEAQAKGLFTLVYDALDPELATAKKLIQEHALLERKIGTVLIALQTKADKAGIRFEAVTERELKLTKKSVARFVKVSQLDLFEGVDQSADAQAAVIAAPPSKRQQVAEALETQTIGQATEELTKEAKRTPAAAPDTGAENPKKLRRERERITTTIHRLEERLEEIDTRLESMAAVAVGG